MKNFFSRSHAIQFLEIPEAALQSAVNHGWITPIRLGPSQIKTEFFLRLDLIDFREKYRSGYYEPSAIMKRRRQRQRRFQVPS